MERRELGCPRVTCGCGCNRGVEEKEQEDEPNLKYLFVIPRQV